MAVCGVGPAHGGIGSAKAGGGAVFGVVVEGENIATAIAHRFAKRLQYTLAGVIIN